MTTKVLEKKLTEIEERLRKLESMQHTASSGRSAQSILDDSLRKQREKMLTRTAGAWKDLKENPLTWQRKTRKTWNKRAKKLDV